LSAPENIDVKTKIVQEATRLFARRGFGGTSVQAVADAVGIRKPSLLYHFPSKDVLRETVLERVLVHWKNEIPLMLNAASTGADQFESTLLAVVRFFREDPNRARLIVRELFNRPRVMQELFAKHLQPWTSLVTDYIRRGQERGNVRADLDPESWLVGVVTMSIGAIAGGEVTSSILGKHVSIDSQLRELVRMARVSLFTPSYNEPSDEEV
jgi:TetR/AcrR family transcriptional regulator